MMAKKMKSKLVRFALISVAVSMMAGCSTLKQQLVDNVSFRIEGVDAAMSLRQGSGIIPDVVTDLGVTIEVGNDSPIALRLLQMNYEVFVGNSLIGQGANQDEVKIDANGGRSSVLLNISLSGKELLAEGFNLARDRTLPPLRIEGAGIVKSPVGNHAIPFTLRYNDATKSSD